MIFENVFGIMHFTKAGVKMVGFDRCAFFYFLRLAFFFGFVGLMSEIFRIMSSKRGGWLYGFVFTLWFWTGWIE